MTIYIIFSSMCSDIGKGWLTGYFKHHLINIKKVIKFDSYLNNTGTLTPSEHGDIYVTPDKREMDQDGKYYNWINNIDIINISLYNMIEKYKSLNQEFTYDINNILYKLISDILNNLTGDCLIEIGGTIEEYSNTIFLVELKKYCLFNDIEIKQNMIIPFLKEKKRMYYHIINKNPCKLFFRVNDKKEKSFIEQTLNYYFGDNLKNVHYIKNYDSYDNFLNDKEFYYSLFNNQLQNFIRIKKKNYKVLILGKFNSISEYSILNLVLKRETSSINYINISINSINNIIKKIEANDFIIFPGGFGSRETDKYILLWKKILEKKYPNKIFLGICLGHQLFSCALTGLTSEEWNNNTSNHLIKKLNNRLIGKIDCNNSLFSGEKIFRNSYGELVNKKICIENKFKNIFTCQYHIEFASNILIIDTIEKIINNNKNIVKTFLEI